MKKTLALIFGGEGAERRISERGAAREAERLAPYFELLKIGIDERGGWYIYRGENEKIRSGEWRTGDELIPTFPLMLEGVSGFLSGSDIIPVDAAFPLLHGDFGEDGRVQGALSAAHIPYIGSGVAPSALTADKAYTKILAEHLGIRTAPWYLPSGRDARKIKRAAEERLGYPMFIKPRTGGSSIGAASVSAPREFLAAYRLASEYGDVIIERRLEVAYELELAHFSGTKSFISGAGVISTHGSFYDFSAKYEGVHSPEISANAKVERKLLREARRSARLLSELLSLGNISRIDFLVTASGELFFNEINSIPGMTEDSLYARLAETAGSLKEPFAVDAVASGKLQ